MVHDYGRDRIPETLWPQPGVFDRFQDLIKIAEEFDKVAKQPHCEDPEKTAFMKDLEKKLGKQVADEKKARDTAERQVAALEQEVAALKAELAAARKAAEVDLECATSAQANFTTVLAAFARLLAWDGEDVHLTGLAHGWVKVVLALPTGQVVWHVDPTHAAAFTGLPFGVPETDEPSEDDNRARLNAWKPHLSPAEHKVIPVVMTPERVESVLAPLDLSKVEVVARPALPIDLPDNGLRGALGGVLGGVAFHSGLGGHVG